MTSSKDWSSDGNLYVMEALSFSMFPPESPLIVATGSWGAVGPVVRRWRRRCVYIVGSAKEERKEERCQPITAGIFGNTDRTLPWETLAQREGRV
jgi:hypothetical protein